LMLSTHYPLAFATQYNWLIAGLVFLMGVTIRHYFNTVHARKGNPTWTWLATVVLFIGIMWLSTVPLMQNSLEQDEARALSTTEQVFASAAGFDEVSDIVLGRCSMCHSREPTWDGMYRAPKGVLLETPGDIAKAARLVFLQAGATHAMPPANVTYMEQAERNKILRWYRKAAPGIFGQLASN